MLVSSLITVSVMPLCSDTLDADERVTTHPDNLRPEVGVTQRQKSPIIGLKNFNNWVKSVLIAQFAHPVLQGDEDEGKVQRDGKTVFSRNRGGGRVLDLGCGKGGDLNKWQKAKVKEYVGIGKSFFHAARRISSTKV